MEIELRYHSLLRQVEKWGDPVTVSNLDFRNSLDRLEQPTVFHLKAPPRASSSSDPDSKKNKSNHDGGGGDANNNNNSNNHDSHSDSEADSANRTKTAAASSSRSMPLPGEEGSRDTEEDEGSRGWTPHNVYCGSYVIRNKVACFMVGSADGPIDTHVLKEEVLRDTTDGKMKDPGSDGSFVLHEAVFADPVEIDASAPLVIMNVHFLSDVAVRGCSWVFFINCHFSEASLCERCLNLFPSESLTHHFLGSRSTPVGGASGMPSFSTGVPSLTPLDTQRTMPFHSRRGTKSDTVGSYSAAAEGGGDPGVPESYRSASDDPADEANSATSAFPTAMVSAESVSLAGGIWSLLRNVGNSRHNASVEASKIRAGVVVGDSACCFFSQCNVYGGLGGVGVLAQDQCSVELKDTEVKGHAVSMMAIEVRDSARLVASYCTIERVIGCGVVASHVATVQLLSSTVSQCGAIGVVGLGDAQLRIRDSCVEFSLSGTNLSVCNQAHCSVERSTIIARLPPPPPPPPSDSSLPGSNASTEDKNDDITDSPVIGHAEKFNRITKLLTSDIADIIGSDGYISDLDGTQQRPLLFCGQSVLATDNTRLRLHTCRLLSMPLLPDEDADAAGCEASNYTAGSSTGSGGRHPAAAADHSLELFPVSLTVFFPPEEGAPSKRYPDSVFPLLPSSSMETSSFLTRLRTSLLHHYLLSRFSLSALFLALRRNSLGEKRIGSSVLTTPPLLVPYWGFDQCLQSDFQCLLAHAENGGGSGGGGGGGCGNSNSDSHSPFPSSSSAPSFPHAAPDANSSVFIPLQATLLSLGAQPALLQGGGTYHLVVRDTASVAADSCVFSLLSGTSEEEEKEKQGRRVVWPCAAVALDFLPFSSVPGGIAKATELAVLPMTEVAVTSCEQAPQIGCEFSSASCVVRYEPQGSSAAAAAAGTATDSASNRLNSNSEVVDSAGDAAMPIAPSSTDGQEQEEGKEEEKEKGKGEAESIRYLHDQWGLLLSAPSSLPECAPLCDSAVEEEEEESQAPSPTAASASSASPLSADVLHVDAPFARDSPVRSLEPASCSPVVRYIRALERAAERAEQQWSRIELAFKPGNAAAAADASLEGEMAAEEGGDTTTDSTREDGTDTSRGIGALIHHVGNLFVCVADPTLDLLATAPTSVCCYLRRFTQTHGMPALQDLYPTVQYIVRNTPQSSLDSTSERRTSTGPPLIVRQKPKALSPMSSRNTFGDQSSASAAAQQFLASISNSRMLHSSQQWGVLTPPLMDEPVQMGDDTVDRSNSLRSLQYQLPSVITGGAASRTPLRRLTLTRVFAGDEWGRLLEARFTEVKECFLHDVVYGCSVARSALHEVELTSGSLHASVVVEHENTPDAATRLTESFAQYDFPHLMRLYRTGVAALTTMTTHVVPSEAPVALVARKFSRSPNNSHSGRGNVTFEDQDPAHDTHTVAPPARNSIRAEVAADRSYSDSCSGSSGGGPGGGSGRGGGSEGGVQGSHMSISGPHSSSLTLTHHTVASPFRQADLVGGGSGSGLERSPFSGDAVTAVFESDRGGYGSESSGTAATSTPNKPPLAYPSGFPARHHVVDEAEGEAEENEELDTEAEEEEEEEDGDGGITAEEMEPPHTPVPIPPAPDSTAAGEEEGMETEDNGEALVQLNGSDNQEEVAKTESIDEQEASEEESERGYAIVRENRFKKDVPDEAELSAPAETHVSAEHTSELERVERENAVKTSALSTSAEEAPKDTGALPLTAAEEHPPSSTLNNGRVEEAEEDQPAPEASVEDDNEETEQQAPEGSTDQSERNAANEDEGLPAPDIHVDDESEEALPSAAAPVKEEEEEEEDSQPTPTPKSEKAGVEEDDENEEEAREQEVRDEGLKNAQPEPPLPQPLREEEEEECDPCQAQRPADLQPEAEQGGGPSLLTEDAAEAYREQETLQEAGTATLTSLPRLTAALRGAPSTTVMETPEYREREPLTALETCSPKQRHTVSIPEALVTVTETPKYRERRSLSVTLVKGSPLLMAERDTHPLQETHVEPPQAPAAVAEPNMQVEQEALPSVETRDTPVEVLVPEGPAEEEVTRGGEHVAATANAAWSATSDGDRTIDGQLSQGTLYYTERESLLASHSNTAPSLLEQPWQSLPQQLTVMVTPKHRELQPLYETSPHPISLPEAEMPVEVVAPQDRESTEYDATNMSDLDLPLEAGLDSSQRVASSSSSSSSPHSVCSHDQKSEDSRMASIKGELLLSGPGEPAAPQPEAEQGGGPSLQTEDASEAYREQETLQEAGTATLTSLPRLTAALRGAPSTTVMETPEYREDCLTATEEIHCPPRLAVKVGKEVVLLIETPEYREREPLTALEPQAKAKIMAVEESRMVKEAELLLPKQKSSPTGVVRTVVPDLGVMGESSVSAPSCGVGERYDDPLTAATRVEHETEPFNGTNITAPFCEDRNDSTRSSGEKTEEPFSNGTALLSNTADAAHASTSSIEAGNESGTAREDALDGTVAGHANTPGELQRSDILSPPTLPPSPSLPANTSTSADATGNAGRDPFLAARMHPMLLVPEDGPFKILSPMGRQRVLSPRSIGAAQDGVRWSVGPDNGPVSPTSPLSVRLSHDGSAVRSLHLVAPRFMPRRRTDGDDKQLLEINKIFERYTGIENSVQRQSVVAAAAAALASSGDDSTAAVLPAQDSGDAVRASPPAEENLAVCAEPAAADVFSNPIGQEPRSRTSWGSVEEPPAPAPAPLEPLHAELAVPPAARRHSEKEWAETRELLLKIKSEVEELRLRTRTPSTSVPPSPREQLEPSLPPQAQAQVSVLNATTQTEYEEEESKEEGLEEEEEEEEELLPIQREATSSSDAATPPPPPQLAVNQPSTPPYPSAGAALPRTAPAVVAAVGGQRAPILYESAYMSSSPSRSSRSSFDASSNAGASGSVSRPGDATKGTPGQTTAVGTPTKEKEKEEEEAEEKEEAQLQKQQPSSTTNATAEAEAVVTTTEGADAGDDSTAKGSPSYPRPHRPRGPRSPEDSNVFFDAIEELDAFVPASWRKKSSKKKGSDKDREKRAKDHHRRHHHRHQTDTALPTLVEPAQPPPPPPATPPPAAAPSEPSHVSSALPPPPAPGEAPSLDTTVRDDTDRYGRPVNPAYRCHGSQIGQVVSAAAASARLHVYDCPAPSPSKSHTAVVRRGGGGAPPAPLSPPEEERGERSEPKTWSLQLIRKLLRSRLGDVSGALDDDDADDAGYWPQPAADAPPPLPQQRAVEIPLVSPSLPREARGPKPRPRRHGQQHRPHHRGDDGRSTGSGGDDDDTRAERGQTMIQTPSHPTDPPRASVSPYALTSPHHSPFLFFAAMPHRTQHPYRESPSNINTSATAAHVYSQEAPLSQQPQPQPQPMEVCPEYCTAPRERLSTRRRQRQHPQPDASGIPDRFAPYRPRATSGRPSSHAYRRPTTTTTAEEEEGEDPKYKYSYSQYDGDGNEENYYDPGEWEEVQQQQHQQRSGRVTTPMSGGGRSRPSSSAVAAARSAGARMYREHQESRQAREVYKQALAKAQRQAEASKPRHTLSPSRLDSLIDRVYTEPFNFRMARDATMAELTPEMLYHFYGCTFNPQLAQPANASHTTTIHNSRSVGVKGQQKQRRRSPPRQREEEEDDEDVNAQPYSSRIQRPYGSAGRAPRPAYY